MPIPRHLRPVLAGGVAMVAAAALSSIPGGASADDSWCSSTGGIYCEVTVTADPYEEYDASHGDDGDPIGSIPIGDEPPGGGGPDPDPDPSPTTTPATTTTAPATTTTTTTTTTLSPQQQLDRLKARLRQLLTLACLDAITGVSTTDFQAFASAVRQVNPLMSATAIQAAIEQATIGELMLAGVQWRESPKPSPDESGLSIGSVVIGGLTYPTVTVHADYWSAPAYSETFPGAITITVNMTTTDTQAYAALVAVMRVIRPNVSAEAVVLSVLRSCLPHTVTETPRDRE